jgi:pentatricopeptide repeat protein
VAGRTFAVASRLSLIGRKDGALRIFKRMCDRGLSSLL